MNERDDFDKRANNGPGYPRRRYDANSAGMNRLYEDIRPERSARQREITDLETKWETS